MTCFKYYSFFLLNTIKCFQVNSTHLTCTYTYINNEHFGKFKECFAQSHLTLLKGE